MTHYDITIGNELAMAVHCDIIMGHDVIMGRATYDDAIHTDVARILIYYVLLCPIMRFLFS